jgi:hypothetical protein
MNERDPKLEEMLPTQLKLRVLEAELDRLDCDAQWLKQRKEEILEEMRYHETLLSKTGPRRLLRRIK